MDDFSTYENAIEIFRKLNCVGQLENNIVGGTIDSSTSANNISQKVGFRVGGIAGQAIVCSAPTHKKIDIINENFWVLINQTENGIGILPLDGKRIMLYRPEKLKPIYKDFAFFSFQEIKSIKMHDSLNMFKTSQTINIKFNEGGKLNLVVSIVENFVPYQESCMKRLMEKYKID